MRPSMGIRGRASEGVLPKAPRGGRREENAEQKAVLEKFAKTIEEATSSQETTDELEEILAQKIIDFMRKRRVQKRKQTVDEAKDPNSKEEQVLDELDLIEGLCGELMEIRRKGDHSGVILMKTRGGKKTVM